MCSGSKRDLSLLNIQYVFHFLNDLQGSYKCGEERDFQEEGKCDQRLAGLKLEDEGNFGVPCGCM